MGGINSLSGLNKLNVDFQPVLDTDAQKTGAADQDIVRPGPDAAPGEAPKAERAEAKSLVRQIDVLLLNAAGKSVSADAAKNVDAAGKSLVDKGVLTRKEASRLVSLAEDATEKLRALDRFQGRELARALMRDRKTGETVWSKGFFGLNGIADAVKSAIEAQQKLSAELGRFNGRLAASKEVDADLQDAFTELQFQCDRRASEIDSIVFKMHMLVQKDAVDGAAADPETAALLDATFKELMPRETILMHGTAEAFEKIDANIREKMRPLAEKLDAFAADGGKVLGDDEIRALQRDMETMENAVRKVRKNGIEAGQAGPDGEKRVARIEVDKSLLDGMEKILADAARQISDAKNVSVKRAREAFLCEVKANLCPESKPGFAGNATDSLMLDFIHCRNEFVLTLYAFARGELREAQFDEKCDACIEMLCSSRFAGLENVLLHFNYDPESAKTVAKTVDGLHLVKAQFKELMKSTGELLKNGGGEGIATGDVRRIMLGETGLSNVVEAKIRGFKPGDIDPAAEESNIAGSKTLGAGAAGKTYLLTTKSGEELVFKPEMDSRIGLSHLLLGMGGAYKDEQKTANLNLATQDAAKALGCQDVVVKYSVGSHDGQFGIFMEKAKGVSGAGYVKGSASGGGGVPPAEMHKIEDPAEQAKIKGAIAQKLNKLMWLDLITGQGDRHWGNYFVHVDEATHEVTVKGIDNDASFGATRIGLRKFALDKLQTALYEQELKNVCKKIHGKGWETEYKNRVQNDPSIVRSGETATIDLAKARSHEARMAIIHTLGLQSIALPEEIDQEVYDRLMEMDMDPAKKQAYFDSIASRISPEALDAAKARLDEAISHAKTLKTFGKVYSAEQWRNGGKIAAMTGFKASVTIATSKGGTVKAGNDIECVRDYNERRCPSYFKREYFHMMFAPPK